VLYVASSIKTQRIYSRQWLLTMMSMIYVMETIISISINRWNISITIITSNINIRIYCTYKIIIRIIRCICNRWKSYLLRIAGMGMVFYPWRLAGAGAGTGFCSWVWISRASIRADFTRCHLYPQRSRQKEC
jgi:hypothetical protein